MPAFYQVPPNFNMEEKFVLKKLKHAEYSLSGEEIRLIQRHGTKLQALMDETIFSTGADDKHFVEVCKGKAEPTTEIERVWLTYLSTLEEEKRLEDIWLEQKKNSPEYEEYFKSRFLSGANRTQSESRSVSTSRKRKRKRKQGKKCSICQAAMENCWKCGGLGWI